MATKPQIKVTPDMVQAVLAQMSAVDLNKAAEEKRNETIKEDIETYLKTDKEQTDRLARIRAVNSDWKPPTVKDRIMSFLRDNGASTKDEIIKGVGVDQVWFALKKLTDDGTVQLDEKTKKYSVASEPAEKE